MVTAFWHRLFVSAEAVRGFCSDSSKLLSGIVRLCEPINKPQAPAVKSRLLQAISPRPSPPGPPLPPVPSLTRSLRFPSIVASAFPPFLFFFLLALAESFSRRCAASLRTSTQNTGPFVSFPARFQTRVPEPAFHFNCFLASSLSSAVSPPSLLFLVSHPIPSVFPYDGELQ